MLEVDFYKLERPLQDRFCDSTRAIGMPAPLLSIIGKSNRPLLWFAGAGILSIAAVAVVGSGLGELEHPRAIAPAWLLAVYCVLFGACAFCFLRGLAAVHSARTKPYRAGLYLFPSGVVDARLEPLRVYRLTEIVSVEVVDGGSAVRLQVRGGPVLAFPTTSNEKASQVRSALEDARGQYEHAVSTNNRREQALLNPLIDSGFVSPFSPKLPLVRKRPAWHLLTPAIAVAAGLAVGAGVWVVRNRVSESRLFARATELATVEAFESYIERGGPRPDVRDILLPRAELAAAVSKGTVEAIEAYAATHPGSLIGPEIDSAVRASLDDELGVAKKTGSVKALREFAERRKKYPYIQKPVTDATTALYKQALQRFTAEANTKNSEVLAFFERLLGYAQTHSPQVLVRFARELPESAKTADSLVRLSAYYMGPESIPSQYFRGDFAAAREDRAAADLVARLQKPFSKEILDFVIEPPVVAAEGEDAVLPEVNVPTLFIRHAPNLAGGYMNPKPRGVFVGLGMMVQAEFVIPDGGPPFRFKASSWKTPNALILRKDGAKVSDVYEDMASIGYERFTRTFLGLVFEEN